MRSLELMPNEADWLGGPDVVEAQTALGLRGRAVDGIFGPDTALAVQEWKWRFGFPRRHVNGRLGLQGRAWLLGLTAQPADFRRRAEQRRGVPFPGGGGGYVAPLPVSMGHGSEFRVVDAEGAPGPGGRKYHAAKDWFAPGGTPVRAPAGSRIREARPSLGDTGQVFGGTVKSRSGTAGSGSSATSSRRSVSGTPWSAGSPWRQSPPERTVPRMRTSKLRKTLAGGYNLGNMIDPVTVLR